MLNILHILESYTTGGAEKVVYELCNGLENNTFRSYVVAFRDGDMRDAFENICCADLLHKHSGPDLRLLYLLCVKIRELKIDLVHAVNGLTVVNYGVIAARLTGIPVVVSIHGVSHFIEKGIGAGVWRKMLGLANERIAVSADIKKRAIHCTGNTRSVELIYNGIEERVPPPAESFRSSFFNELGLPQDAQLAVCVANLREIKGHVHLLTAMSCLIERHPRFHLLLIGAGPLDSFLRGEIMRFNLQGRVHMTGLRNDVPDCLSLCDMFVLPSLSEGTPLCLLEAMRAGLPIVASRVGGIPEIVIDGQTGILVEPCNPLLLAQAVEKIIVDREFSERCSKNAEMIFNEQFGKHIMLKRYSKLLLETALQQ